MKHKYIVQKNIKERELEARNNILLLAIYRGIDSE